MTIFRNYLRSRDVTGLVNQIRLKKPRPIILRFLCYPDMRVNWANRRNLKGTNIFLSEDLPKSVQSTRRTVRPYLKIAQKSDQNATIRNDKLLYKGKYYDLHEIPRSMYICFGGQSSIFSNFFPAPLEIDGTQFNHGPSYLLYM